MIEDLERDRCIFGRTLNSQRTQIGKSVGQIADELGVSGATVRQWESSNVLPVVDRLPLIAAAYERDPHLVESDWKISKAARREELKIIRDPPRFRAEKNRNYEGFHPPGQIRLNIPKNGFKNR